jgi:dolichyldiphosphatase
MASVEIKHFSLTHIVHPPTPAGTLLALLSLSPIFLFVSYFTLAVFGRRLSLVLLAAGSVFNEALSLGLKRTFRAPRPFPNRPHVGHGFGMPSSHTQTAAFVLAWGVGYALSLEARYSATTAVTQRVKLVRRVRTGIYLFGLAAWSLTVAYSRYVNTRKQKVN